MPTILDFLKGINPMFAGTLPGDYLSQQNAIQQALANKLFGLDLQQQNVQQGYEADVGDLGLQRERQQEGWKNAAANRGTLKSGMTIRGGEDINTNINKLLGAIGRQRNVSIADIIGQRLQGQSDAAGSIADLNSRIAGQGQAALVADAQAQAQMRQDQATGAYQQAQYNQNAAIANAQIRAYQAQANNTQMPPGMNISMPSNMSLPTGQTATANKPPVQSVPQVSSNSPSTPNKRVTAPRKPVPSNAWKPV